MSVGGMQMSAGGTQMSAGGMQISMGGMKVACGRDAGGTLSYPARLLEVSIRRRKGALCKPPPCLTLLN